jgi:predicted ATPase
MPQDWILQAVVEVKGRSNTRQRGIAAQRSVGLVTGMSGTGKSSALAGLAHRRHQAVDTDDPGRIIESQTPDRPEPLWDLGAVGALLDRTK